ncbi:hypothetical protein HMPREF0322_01229 [Desulfitobacterium hafniense DP7]|uniref:Uncharacterized protein n=1 Tax=Desulfitobacterium hafniense DP7 TaxID=537010 RepID=G9XJU8_DESHA|nr:hypothetical protein HMPREF0322_01229 [Desulfitobacterium hafniense DP7]
MLFFHKANLSFFISGPKGSGWGSGWALEEEVSQINVGKKFWQIG